VKTIEVRAEVQIKPRSDVSSRGCPPAPSRSSYVRTTASTPNHWARAGEPAVIRLQSPSLQGGYAQGRPGRWTGAQAAGLSGAPPKAIRPPDRELAWPRPPGLTRRPAPDAAGIAEGYPAIKLGGAHAAAPRRSRGEGQRLPGPRLGNRAAAAPPDDPGGRPRGYPAAAFAQKNSAAVGRPSPSAAGGAQGRRRGP
jgi:hypothetical protein